MGNELSVTKEGSLEEVSKKLIGLTLVLDPKMGGMLKDELNDFTLDFFSEGHDKIVFKKEMNPTQILKNIKAGILRVEKNDKDVTKDFGGPERIEWRRTPVIDGVPKRVDKDSKEDQPLLNLLGRNKESEIIRDIQSIKDYKLLERLKELEEQGNNPSATGRSNVVDAIVKVMKEVPGVGEVKELPQEKKDVISAK